MTKLRGNSDSSNPIIVFDQDNPDDQAPIEMCYRQPSFIRLQGDPIPKGFDSLDEFQAEHEIVRVDSVRDKFEPSTNIQELLQKRNAKKWEQMGYDPKSIDLALNRHNSTTNFKTADNLQINTAGKMCSSFSQLDSFKYKKPKAEPLPLLPLYEVCEEENPIEQTKTPILRSLSSGVNFPRVELPTNSKTEYVEVEEDYSDYSDEMYLSILENGMTMHVAEILKHEPTTLVYKVLCGTDFPDLPYDIVNIITDELTYYTEECLENGHELDSFHVQSLIENLRKTADRSLMPGFPSEIGPELFKKKLLDLYKDYEKKVEYWDTQSFLNNDGKERSLKKLSQNPKINSLSAKQDEIKKINFNFEKTEFNIKKGRTEDLQNLKSAIARLKNGDAGIDPLKTSPSALKNTLSRNTGPSKINKLRISNSTIPKIIRPQTHNKLYRS